MSWQELAAEHYDSLDRSNRPYSSPAELRLAMEIASTATRLAKQQPEKPVQKTDSLADSVSDK